jgi:hypothetical protein
MRIAEYGIWNTEDGTRNRETPTSLRAPGTENAKRYLARNHLSLSRNKSERGSFYG